MTANPLFYDGTEKAAMDTRTALLNNGSFRIYTGSQPSLNGAVSGTLLVTLTFGATAFAASVASGGTVTATANAITSGTAGNSGTAGYFALVKSDGTTVVATGTCGTSAADFIMNSTAITASANVSCTAFQITQAQT